MKYRITNVVDYNGNPKSYRMGSIVTIEQLDIGRSAVFKYLNKEMSPHFGFVTSEVKFIQHDIAPNGDRYLIETENSVYYLASYEE